MNATIENTAVECLARCTLELALNRKQGKYAVKLSNVGNPDHRQDSRRPLPDTTCGWAHVDTIEEASEICRLYIGFYDLGGGNWNGGQIECQGAQVGRISYNGRAWDMNGKEIL